MSVTAPSTSVICFPPTTPPGSPNNFLARREAAHRRALADHRLRAASAKVFGFILEHVNRQSGGWCLCMKTIAAGTSMGERNARRCVAELEKHGYLRRISDPGHANFYQVWEGDPGQTCSGGRTNLSGVPRTNLSAITLESVTSESTLRKKETNFVIEKIQGREGSLPSEARKPSDSPTSDGVPRGPNGGGARGWYVGPGSLQMIGLEEYERARGRSFPRDKRGGWLLTHQEWAAVQAWITAAEGAGP
jgi:hypothetical protein